MPDLIVYAFLAIVQVEGMMGGAEQALEACKESRATILAKHTVLMASECAPVTLRKMTVKPNV